MCSCNNCKAHMSAISAQRGGGWFVGGELSAAVGDHWACAQHRHRAHATEEEGGGEGELRTIFEENLREPPALLGPYLAVQPVRLLRCV